MPQQGPQIPRATAQAHSELLADDVENQFAALEKQQELDRLLDDLKSKRKSE